VESRLEVTHTRNRALRREKQLSDARVSFLRAMLEQLANDARAAVQESDLERVTAEASAYASEEALAGFPEPS
jgi:hypothetical protein